MIGVVHVHSCYSHDGRDTIAALRAFAGSRNLAFVALSDHAEDLDGDAFERLRRECAAVSSDAIQMIPGLEFRFEGLKGMHLLALGLTQWIEPKTPHDFIEMTRTTAALTVAAHPMLPRYEYPQTVLDGIHAIEVWNAAYNTRYLPDPRAIRLYRRLLARRPDVVAVVGLDQHDARNDRETRIVTADDGDPLASIRAGRFRNVGRTMSFDGQAALGPIGAGGLWAARTMFDAVERAQDRTARRLRRWKNRRRGPNG